MSAEKQSELQNFHSKLYTDNQQDVHSALPKSNKK
jgi:hypothetical protein